MEVLHRIGSSSIVAGLVIGCVPNSAGLGGSPGLEGSTGSAPVTSGSSSEASGPASSSTADGSATGEGSTGPEGDSSSGTGEPVPWPSGPFGPPVRIEILSTDTNDDDPSLTADQLELFFASHRNPTEDIFVSTRASVREGWGAPQLVAEANSPFEENTPEVSGDGLVLMFGSMRRGLPDDMDIYISYRSARDQPFGVPQLVEALSSDRMDIAPTLTPGLERIYLCSTRMGAMMGQEVWSTNVMGGGGVLSFGLPQPVMELNTPTNDCTVSLSPDRRVVYFDSDREGTFGLWMATRDEPGQAFGAAVPMGELNLDDATDMDPWISPDGHVIYFSSTREGSQDIFYAER